MSIEAEMIFTIATLSSTSHGILMVLLGDSISSQICPDQFLLLYNKAVFGYLLTPRLSHKLILNVPERPPEQLFLFPQGNNHFFLLRVSHFVIVGDAGHQPHLVILPVNHPSV